MVTYFGSPPITHVVKKVSDWNCFTASVGRPVGRYQSVIYAFRGDPAAKHYVEIDIAWFEDPFMPMISKLTPS